MRTCDNLILYYFVGKPAQLVIIYDVLIKYYHLLRKSYVTNSVPIILKLASQLEKLYIKNKLLNEICNIYKDIIKLKF